MNVFIEGAATTKFGELWNRSPRDLVGDVVRSVLKESQTEIKSIDAVIIGNMLSGSLAGQEHLGSFFAAELGLTCSATRVEGACASGGLAVHTAVAAIESEMYERGFLFFLGWKGDAIPPYFCLISCKIAILI